MGEANPKIDIQGTGLRIKQIMQEKNFTVKDIQDYLGFGTAQSIYHWFKGRNMPTVDNLYALSELFGVPIDEMICGDRKNIRGHRLFSYCEVITARLRGVAPCEQTEVEIYKL